MINISLQGIPTKLCHKFPDDPKYDILISYKDYEYRLQKPYLRLYSTYFHHSIKLGCNKIIITQDFSEIFLYHVLSLFYGFSIEVKREDALSYLQIIEFFGINSLSRIFHQDILTNINSYDFFDVLEISHHYNLQQIFQLCLQQLENKQFVQILQYRESFLRTSMPIFKLVIKSHNKLKNKKNCLSPYEIQDLIFAYCKGKNLDYRYSSCLKLQMIDKNTLTATEYRDIFLMDQGIAKNFQQTLQKKKEKDYNLMATNNISVSVGIGSIAAYPQKSYSHRSLQLGLETTFQQKIKEELIKKQQKIIKEVHEVENQFHNQSFQDIQLATSIQQFGKRIKNNADSRLITDRMNRIDRKINKLQISMNENNLKLKGLLEKTGEIFQKYDIKEQSRMEMSEVNSRSSLCFGKQDFITTPLNTPKTPKLSAYPQTGERDKNMFKKDQIPIIEGKIEATKKNPEKTPKRSPKNNEKIQNFITHSFWESEKHLQFNLRPMSIHTEKQLSNLADLIAPDRFQFKQLDLILRRSMHSTAFGNAIDLKGYSNLLILFRTESGKVVGGKTSVSIPLLAQDYVEDPNAFIFSVTQNKKFRIQKSLKDQAILINDKQNYIFCFNTDLMISGKCLDQQNFCNWPETYQANKDKNCSNAEWLVGDNPFRITQLECYHIENSGYQEITY